jgi:hypothetical protein
LQRVGDGIRDLEHLLMHLLERIDPLLELDVVGRELSLSIVMLASGRMSDGSW